MLKYVFFNRKTEMSNAPDFKLNGNWAKYTPGTHIMTQAYQTYNHMIDRTKPGGKFQAKRPTYIGTSNGFTDFQQFADWAIQQVGYGVPGYQLDKDLLVPGNKVYCQETCCFLPREINMALQRDQSNKKSGLPVGIYRNHKSDLKATISIRGKNVHLASTPTSTEADIAHLSALYETAKSAYLKALAIEHQLNLDPRAFAALMAL